MWRPVRIECRRGQVTYKKCSTARTFCTWVTCKIYIAVRIQWKYKKCTTAHAAAHIFTEERLSRPDQLFHSKGMDCNINEVRCIKSSHCSAKAVQKYKNQSSKHKTEFLRPFWTQLKDRTNLSSILSQVYKNIPLLHLSQKIDSTLKNRGKIAFGVFFWKITRHWPFIFADGPEKAREVGRGKTTPRSSTESDWMSQPQKSIQVKKNLPFPFPSSWCLQISLTLPFLQETLHRLRRVETIWLFHPPHNHGKNPF